MAEKTEEQTDVSKVEAQQEEYTVKSGDSLSAIAEDKLGDGNRWREIYDANKDQIGADPDLIQPGMKLKLPS